MGKKKEVIKATGNKHKLTASEQKRSDRNRKTRDAKATARKKSRQ